MKSARETGASSKDIGIEIQRLTDTIKVAVADEFAPRLTELRNLTEQNVSAVASRTWPWFLFADQAM